MTTFKRRLALGLALWWSLIPSVLAADPMPLKDLQQALEVAQPQIQFTRTPPTATAFIPEQAVLQGYTLGVGDVLEVHLFNPRVNLLYSLTVGPEGQIVIPRLGAFTVAGKTTAEVQQLIVNRAPARDPVEISVTLQRVRPIQVMVTGFVESPGFVQVPWGTRLLDVVRRAGGVRQSGSLRQLHLRQGGREQTLDLYRFHYQGDLQANPVLKGGEQIHIPALGPHVALIGQLQQPGIYEVRPGDSLSQLLSLAGGLKPAADPQGAVYWPQGLSQGRPEVLPLTPDYALSAGDVLYYPLRRLPSEEKLIHIYGQVRDPGVLAYRPALTLAEALRGVGGPLQTADLGAIKISRLKGDNREVVQANLQAYLFEGQSDTSLMLEPGDVILVPETFFVIRNVTELTTLLLSLLGIVSVVINLSRGGA
jgi:polysaccharide export outer membrane protein